VDPPKKSSGNSFAYDVFVDRNPDFPLQIDYEKMAKQLSETLEGKG